MRHRHRDRASHVAPPLPHHHRTYESVNDGSVIQSMRFFAATTE
jgi:hypothetical protein